MKRKKINKVKKISKYLTNTLGMVSMLLVGLNGIDGINIPIQVYEVIAVIQGVIGAYLVQGKLFSLKDGEE